MGTASMRCVRPIFTMCSQPRALASSSSRSSRSAGTSASLTSYAVATDMAVGNVSLDDCDMLTWSLGCTGLLLPTTPPRLSMARLEMTSLTFMLVCVPLPVCHTTSGKCSSNLPSMTSRAATRMASARRASSMPSCSLTVAAACLTMASARSMARGIFSPPILKFCSDRWVCAPQYLSAGTLTTPMVSLSSLQPAEEAAVSVAAPCKCAPCGTTRPACDTPSGGFMSSSRREPTPAVAAVSWRWPTARSIALSIATVDV
mmetsp:Transcript_1228/g.2849  ORF Transcript_1228/g.2849 Transcript_1228/m.2849 type:complete len:259 (+) Transcript_1228:1126-1902(+)